MQDRRSLARGATKGGSQGVGRGRQATGGERLVAAGQRPAKGAEFLLQLQPVSFTRLALAIHHWISGKDQQMQWAGSEWRGRAIHQPQQPKATTEKFSVRKGGVFPRDRLGGFVGVEQEQAVGFLFQSPDEGVTA
jgi:hypothetical protein